MVNEFIGRPRRSVGRDISGTCYELAANWRDPSSDEARIRYIAQPNCRVEAFAHQIDKSIAIGSMDLKLRMAAREFGQDGRELGHAERERC
jgi:hypothetical protein